MQTSNDLHLIFTASFHPHNLRDCFPDLSTHSSIEEPYWHSIPIIWKSLTSSFTHLIWCMWCKQQPNIQFNNTVFTSLHTDKNRKLSKSCKCIPGTNLKLKSAHEGFPGHGHPPPHGSQNSNGGPLERVSWSSAMISATVWPLGRFSYTTGR